MEEFLEVEVRYSIHAFLRQFIDGGHFQRHKLGSNLTPVTPETFAKWKKTRMDKKEAEQEAMRKAKETQNSAGKNVGMSGRDLVGRHPWSDLLLASDPSFHQFQYNPEWFEDEDDGDASDDWDLEKYRRAKEEEDTAAEESRIANLGLHDGYHDGEGDGSGGGIE